MMAGNYTALITVSGLPAQGKSLRFDTAQDAWRHLAQERKRDEDRHPGWPMDTGEYTETYQSLDRIASGEHEHGSPHEDWPTNADGTGRVVGDTPGVRGSDPGCVYSVGLADA